jgi:hypothetical protein
MSIPTLSPLAIGLLDPNIGGISYLCPMCFELLGVAIDPIALKAEIVAEVLDGLAAKAKKK